MAAPAAATPQQPVSAQVVGNAFVQQYYHILHQSPGLVHRFYQDISKLGRPEEDGTMSLTTTMDAINSKIVSLNYDELKAEIKSVDAQESLNGGVNVLVTGHVTGKDNILKKFTQSFFLAPQDKGYFVLNDMFRYIENVNHSDEKTVPVEAPINPEQGYHVAPFIVQFRVVDDLVSQVQVPNSVAEVENDNDINIPEQEVVVVPIEETEVEVVFNSPPEKVETVADVAEEEPVAEVVDEVQEVSQLVVESDTKIEEVPKSKKSYASIVMDLKQNGVAFSPPPRKPQPRIQEVNLVPPPVSAADSAPAVNGDAVENEEEGDGYSIYIKGLPMSATPAILDDEFKKFGPIKVNGIQVRSNRGFCFGFVEFETPEAVQKAIEASPVLIGGRNAVVEEKRSTNSKGGIRGRFPPGRGGGGFRNEGMRGRGNYNTGGRGYNRGGGDFSGGRNDYGGNRGGGRGGAPPHRGGTGGDGYQRDRVNHRGGGMGVNGTAKNMAPRVQATA